MRISTNQVYETGTQGIQHNQSSLYKLQNQLSTGRRVLAPADDPVAASRALVVTQSKGVTAQHAENQAAAREHLGLVEGTLNSLTDLVQHTRERVVQAGNTMLTNNDRAAIATELEARFQDLLGLANTADGAGQYMFSGYQGGTRPFALDPSVAASYPATAFPVKYSGDDGERLLQVGASRQMGVNLSGNDLFVDIKTGNGNFTTGVGGNVNPPPSTNNLGSATIDAGSVLDHGLWQTAVNAHGALNIQFAVDPVTGATTYQIYDVANSPNGLLAAPKPYTPGQIIRLEQTEASPPLTTPPGDFGAQVLVDGVPADGDRFQISPSTGQSAFQTFQNLIGLLRQPVSATSSFTPAEFSNRLSAELTNLDRTLDNINTKRADVGARLNELDSLTDIAKDLDVQYASTLSDLQDLDYAAAITEFSKRQTQLEAAQKSYAQISQLNLFNYL